MVSAGKASVSVLNSNGEVYTWGANLNGELGLGDTRSFIQIPTKVENLTDIRYINAGNCYQMAINKQGEVYATGLNDLGQFGNGTNINTREFIKIETIKDVFGVSDGNTYTNFLKIDGTVWATGDYAHGDTSVLSKTKGNVPIQIGKSEAGFDEAEITIRVNESKDVIANNEEEFNLIYLNKDGALNFIF